MQNAYLLKWHYTLEMDRVKVPQLRQEVSLRHFQNSLWYNNKVVVCEHRQISFVLYLNFEMGFLNRHSTDKKNAFKIEKLPLPFITSQKPFIRLWPNEKAIFVPQKAKNLWPFNTKETGRRRNYIFSFPKHKQKTLSLVGWNSSYPLFKMFFPI